MTAATIVKFPVPPRAEAIEAALRQLMVMPLEVIPAFFGDPVPAISRADLPDVDKAAVINATNAFLICMALPEECGLKPNARPLLISLPFRDQLHIICSMAALNINPVTAPPFLNQHFG